MKDFEFPEGADSKNALKFKEQVYRLMIRFVALTSLTNFHTDNFNIHLYFSVNV